MNRVELVSILKILAQQIGKQRIRWAVGSSAALLLHGFDVDPHDIDIITDELGAHYLNDILNDYCIDPIKKEVIPSNLIHCLVLL